MKDSDITKMKQVALRYSECGLWYFYLILMAGISFLSVRYDNQGWLQYSGVFYYFCCCYLTLVLMGAKYNRLALRYARTPIILFFLILLWLIVQFLLPVSSNSFAELFASNSTPVWFDPSFALSIEPQKTRWVFFANLFVFSLFVLTLSIVTTRRRVKELLISIILIGLMHALIGLYAKFGNIILVDKASLDGHFDAARGLFVNRNHYASFISITLLGAVTYFLKSLIQGWQTRKPLLVALDLVLSPKIIYISATVIGLIALMLSQSRAGLFGFVSAFFMVVTLLYIFDNRFTRRGVTIIILGLLLVVLYFLFGEDIMSRLISDGFSLGERLLQWQITWVAISDAPIFGFGAGSYSTVFQIYREHSELRQVIFDQAHNEYLQLWVEQGLIGLGLFCALITVIIFASVKNYRASSSTLVSALMLSVLIVLLSALAQTMVDFNLQIVNIRSFFFVIIALVYISKSLLRRSS